VLLTLCGCGRIGFAVVNSSAPDAASDSPPPDAPRDARAPDAFAPDAFAPDAFAPDAFAPDAFAPDAFAPDAGAPGCDIYVNDRSIVGDVLTTALGADANPGTPGAPFETIGAALTAAADGAVVCLDVGIYVGDVDVGRSVSIAGARRGVPACGRSGDESVIQGRLSVAASATEVVVDGVRLAPGAGWAGVNLTYENESFRLLNSQVLPGLPAGGYALPGYVATLPGAALGVVEIRGNQFEPGLNDAGCSALWVQAEVRSSLDIAQNCFEDSGDGAMHIESSGALGALVSVSIRENVLLSSRHSRGFNPAAIAVNGRIGALELSRNVVRGFPRSGVLLAPSELVSARLVENILVENGYSTAGGRPRLFANLYLASSSLATGIAPNISGNDLSAPAREWSILYPPAPPGSPARPPISAPCNWYGVTDAASVVTLAGGVDPRPYLTRGLDTDPSAPGFQADPSACDGS
jgi:hypothetical protein